MIMRWTLCLGFVLMLQASARAADLSAIPRTLTKEPAYHGKPRYCLLVFGENAKTRLWLVRDEQNVYLDRNGNGDLTDPGDKSAAMWSRVLLPNVGLSDGPRKDLTLYSFGDNSFRMNYGTGEAMQYVGLGLMGRPNWGEKAADAPIVHFSGPLSLAIYGPPVTVPRELGRGRRNSLRLMIGTPGLGKATFASYDEDCACKLGPVQAEIVFRHANKEGTFTHRCELMPDG